MAQVPVELALERPPGSLEKRNAAVVVIVPVGPPSIVVWGGVVSTVKVRVAGVGSVARGGRRPDLELIAAVGER